MKYFYCAYSVHTKINCVLADDGKSGSISERISLLWQRKYSSWCYQGRLNVFLPFAVYNASGLNVNMECLKHHLS